MYNRKALPEVPLTSEKGLRRPRLSSAVSSLLLGLALVVACVPKPVPVTPITSVQTLGASDLLVPAGQAWPIDLAFELHSTLNNLGIDGATLAQVQSQEVPQAKYADFIVFGSTGDVISYGLFATPLPDYVAGYGQIATALHALGPRKLSIIAYPDLGNTPWALGKASMPFTGASPTPVQVARLHSGSATAYNAVRTVAASSPWLTVVDFYNNPDSYNMANYGPDGLHPSQAGASFFAVTIEGV